MSASVLQLRKRRPQRGGATRSAKGRAGVKPWGQADVEGAQLTVGGRLALAAGPLLPMSFQLQKMALTLRLGWGQASWGRVP